MQILIADGRRQIVPRRILGIGWRLGGVERNVTNAAGEASQVRRFDTRIEIEEFIRVPDRRIEVGIGKETDSHDAAGIRIGAVVQLQAVRVGLSRRFAARIIDGSQLLKALSPRCIGYIAEERYVNRKVGKCGNEPELLLRQTPESRVAARVFRTPLRTQRVSARPQIPRAGSRFLLVREVIAEVIREVSRDSITGLGIIRKPRFRIRILRRRVVLLRTSYGEQEKGKRARRQATLRKPGLL